MIDNIIFVASLLYSLAFFWLKVGLLLGAFLLSVILQLALGRRQSFRADFRQVLKHVQSEAKMLGKNAYSAWPTNKIKHPLTPSTQSHTGSETSVEVESVRHDKVVVPNASKGNSSCKCPFECSCKSPCKCPTNEKQLPEEIEIYTAGACNDNKTASSVGVYFGPRHLLNFGSSLPGPNHSMVRAELEAATWALERLREWKGYDDQPVIIRTDSLQLVVCLQNVHCAGYLSYEARKLRKLAESFPSGVTFEHVYRNCKKHGNDKAVKLAMSELRSTDDSNSNSHSSHPENSYHDNSSRREKKSKKKQKRSFGAQWVKYKH